MRNFKMPGALVLNMDKITWVGMMASIFTTLAALPQLVKIINEKKAENISMMWVIILIAGLCGWVFYGILKKDKIILISNSLAVIINLEIAFHAVKFKKQS